jgi:hypothetical protein
MTIVRVMMLIAIMTLVVLPTMHIVYLVTIASHLMPEVVVLSTTQLQLTLELAYYHVLCCQLAHDCQP